MKTALADRACTHCGTQFTPAEITAEFCCAGCQFVHHLIEEEGLDRFYELKGSERLMPASAAVLLPVDATWAEAVQIEAESRAGEGRLAEARFDLQGISCVGCVWLIEAVFEKAPGAGRCLVNVQRGEISLSWMTGQFDLPGFIARLRQFGYSLAPHTGRAVVPSASGLRLGLCGGLMLNAMAFTLPRYLGMEASFPLAGVFELVAALSATISLLAGGSYFIQRAWAAVRLRRLHLDVPIAAGILAAWLGSVAGWLTGYAGLLYFDFVATFIFLMLLGRRLQEASVAGNRSRLLHSDPLLAAAPSVVRGAELAIPPGAVIPVASELLEGPVSLSLEWINGEAEARSYAAGQLAPAGAVNLGAGPLKVRAREDWAESLLSQLAAPADEETDSVSARWLDRVLRLYLSVVLIASVSGGVWWLISGAGWATALQVSISVLVVSCPCALGVAVPMAHELAVGRLRRLGIFVRRVDLWPRLRRVKRLIFDKTGTLTLEAPGLVDPTVLDRLTPAALEKLALLVRDSRHPFDAGLREALSNRGIVRAAVAGDSVQEEPGKGRRHVDASGAVWTLGRADWAAAGEEPVPEGVDAVFRCDGVALASFRFTESVRPDARTEIAIFRQRGFDVRILSGDSQDKVSAVAACLDLPAGAAHGRLQPAEKAAWVREHGADALFVGDGANDSLAFDAAVCRGTPAVERGLLAEKADFYFLSRSLKPIRQLFEVAALRRSGVRQAFAFALLYNLGAIALALTGHMNPLLAAILMPLSSLVTLAIVRLAAGRRSGGPLG